jgi:hypothetical protein
MLCSDGDSDRPAELPLLLAPIAEGRADITIGSRLAGPRTAGALPWPALFGNWLAASLITNLYGLKISDLGPFRAARADALRAVELEETTYGWAVELILKGATQGFRIVEVPVSIIHGSGNPRLAAHSEARLERRGSFSVGSCATISGDEKTACHGRREIPRGNTYGTSNER